MFHRFFSWAFALVFSLALALAILVTALIYIPQSPLPDYWNPIKPINPLEAPNLLTLYKLKKLNEDPAQCLAALRQLSVRFQSQPDKIDSETCHIKNQVSLTRLNTANLAGFSSTCKTSLRLAMWEYHFVQPSALQYFGSSVVHIDSFGSYSCRRMRTSSGTGERMSEHASANAVDISGFVTKANDRISVKKDWDDPGAKGSFLRDVRNGACTLFNLSLSPDFNDLHADHFHFDNGKWAACR